ncbi:hypothetical protein ERJ75_000999000 [Trypanosoma vivax]|nr:hypothetical protein ERJ75_000999000 [Trypanosoma vivax]
MALCFKCKAEHAVVCSRDGPGKPYCCRCFTDFCTRLIRDSLFRSCGLPCNEPMVVAVSGGHSSMMMLHQLGLLRMQNRLRPGDGYVAFELIPLHLQEVELIAPSLEEPQEPCVSSTKDGTHGQGSVSGAGNTELRRAASGVIEQFEMLEELVRTHCTRWEFASVPLFTPDEIIVVRYSDYLSPTELRAFRLALHHPRLSLTSRELLHTRIRGRVLAIACVDMINRWKRARQVANGWHHMITGENALRCCVTALRELMSGGSGGNVVHHSGHRGLVGQCVVMRPLRTLLPRELVIYCSLHGIANGYTPTLGTYTNIRSINRTLEAFFNSMMTSYRTSIFNVLNTVMKLDVGAAAELLDVDLHAPTTTTVGDGVLPSARGQQQNHKQLKRVIPGKMAQHHFEQLKRKDPPRHRWGGEATEFLQPDEYLCLVCGCLADYSADCALKLSHCWRFACDPCLRLLTDLSEKLPSQVSVSSKDVALSISEGHQTSITATAQATAATEEDSVLLVFHSLATQMESLTRETDNSPNVDTTDETSVARSVRRRLSLHHVREFILPDSDSEWIGEVE